MMTARRLMEYVTAEPFRPFRIKIANGHAFEIRHPEMIFVGRTTAHVFSWASEGDNAPREQEREISMLLIESIEPLEPATTSEGPRNDEDAQ